MAEGLNNGRRLEQLTRQLNVTNSAVERAIELPLGTPLSDVFTGQYELEPSQLVAAADVLSVPVGVLTGRIPIGGHLGTSLRLGVAEALDVPAAALRYADMLLNHQAVLDSWLGRVRNRLSSVPLSGDRYYLNAGRVSAGRVRDAIGAGDAPIGDLVGLVEGTGTPVSFQTLPTDVHGLNVREERDGDTSRVIIVSADGPWTMQRFTLAHELCHALYDDQGQVIVDRVEIPAVLPELRAESFARHLLLPPEPLRSEVELARGNGSDWSAVVAQVMTRWGLSRAAVVKALVADELASQYELSAVSNRRVPELMESAGLAQLWAELSVGEGDPSGSPLLVERAIEAFANGWVGLRLVAELMGQPVELTASQLDAAGWVQHDPF